MLLHDDIVSDGQAEANALPSRFCREEGIDIFSLTSGGMPVPLSRILISTLSPKFFVAAVRVGSYVSQLLCPLRLVAA